MNELQYRVTKERTEGFKRALAMLHKPDNETKKTKPDLWQLHVDAVQSGIDDFTAQMRAYEELINRKPGQTMVGSISLLHCRRLTPKGAATQTKPSGLLFYKSEMLPYGL